MLNERTADHPTWHSGMLLPSWVAWLAVWVTGIVACIRQPEEWFGIAAAMIMASFPVLDLAIRHWRGTLQAGELERVAGALFYVWMALFATFGIVAFR